MYKKEEAKQAHNYYLLINGRFLGPKEIAEDEQYLYDLQLKNKKGKIFKIKLKPDVSDAKLREYLTSCFNVKISKTEKNFFVMLGQG